MANVNISAAYKAALAAQAQQNANRKDAALSGATAAAMTEANRAKAYAEATTPKTPEYNYTQLGGELLKSGAQSGGAMSTVGVTGGIPQGYETVLTTPRSYESAVSYLAERPQAAGPVSEQTARAEAESRLLGKGPVTALELVQEEAAKRVGNPNVNRDRAAEEAKRVSEIKKELVPPLDAKEQLELAAATNFGGGIGGFLDNTHDMFYGLLGSAASGLLREGGAMVTGREDTAAARLADKLDAFVRENYDNDNSFGLVSWRDRVREKYDSRLTPADKRALGLVESGAQMLPSIAIGNLAGAAAGAANAGAVLGESTASAAQIANAANRIAFGLNAGGAAAKEARSEGATARQATEYGALGGLLEVLTESIAGGIPGLPPGALTEAASSVISKLGEVGALPAIQMALDIGGEGVEEVVSEFFQPYIKRIVYDPDAKNATLRELGDAFAGGVALSVLMQAASTAANAAAGGRESAFNAAGTRARTQEGNIPTENEAAAQAAQIAQQAQRQLAASQVPATSVEAIQSQLADKYNPTAAEVDRIAQSPEALRTLGIDQTEWEDWQVRKLIEQRINQEQYRAAAEDGAKKAAPVQERLNSLLDSIAARLGIEHGADSQKSVGSAMSRIYRNVRNGKGGDVYALKDLARGHLELSSWDQIPAVLQMLDENNIPYTADVKSTEQGYRGLHILWNDNGVGIELQLTTPEAWKVKMQTEEIYAKWRDFDIDELTDAQQAEYFKDVAKSVAMWDGVQLPDFNSLASSSSETGVPRINSPQVARVFTHLPSTSTDTRSPAGASVSQRNTLSPSSSLTMRTTESPPFNGNPTIAQGGNDVKFSGESTATDGNSGGLPQGTGAASQGFTTPTTGPQVQTQNRTVTDSTYMSPEERAALEPGTHERQSREMRIERATGQFYNDPEGNVIHLDETVKNLLEKEAWTAADQETAQWARGILIEQARTAETPEAKAEAWERVKEISKAIEEIGGTEAGRSLQARQSWIKSADGIVSEAASILDAAKRSTDVPAILDWIADEADAYERASETGDVDALREIIRRTSEVRRTGTAFRNRLGGGVAWALDRVCEQAKAQLEGGGESEAFEFLRRHAANGLVAYAQDQTPVRASDAFKTIRTNAMLSKFSTAMRNFVSNNVFDPTDSVSRNLSVPLDALLSKFTGTRSVAFDRSWLSSEKRSGSMDGLARSMMEVGLDVDATGERSRYETGGRRTFRMSGGPVSRALSAWEKYMGYLLYSTDQFQKGGIEAEVQRGVDRLYDRGRISDESLEEGGKTEALYRTFQDETALSRLTTGMRRAMNAVQAGGVGAGDIALPFAQVPANLASRAIEYSPAGIAKGAVEIGKALADAKRGTLTAAQQAKAVQSIGRGLNGTGMIAAATALALKGILRVSDNGREDEDKDKRALDREAGLRGTQINLSALQRWAKGESTDWQEGDLLHSIGYLDPLNALLTTGSLIADDYREGDVNLGSILRDSLEGTIQAVLDLPVMNVFKEVAENYRYSNADTEGGRLLDAAKAYGAGQVPSVIPNSIKGVAQAMDDYQRDAYTSSDPLMQAIDNIKLSIPGLRETLPEKLDNYGEPIEQQDALIRALNANVLPGAFARIETPQRDITEALHALSGETGNYGIYPNRKPPNSITSGDEKYDLTAEEKRAFQQTSGGTYQEIARLLLESRNWGSLPATEQADILHSVVAYSNARSRQELIESRGGEYTLTGEARAVEKALIAAENGVDIGRYFLVREEHDRIDDEDISAQAKATRFAHYLDGLALTAQQKTVLQGLLTYSGGFTAEASEKALDAIDAGMSLEDYEKYHEAVSGMSADYDDSGKAISGSKKAKVIEYIEGLNVSADVKDLLYTQQGYAASGLDETPWHQ